MLQARTEAFTDLTHVLQRQAAVDYIMAAPLACVLKQAQCVLCRLWRFWS